MRKKAERSEGFIYRQRRAVAPARGWLWRVACAFIVVATIRSWPNDALAAGADAWPVAGQQGLVRFIIVPNEQATDQAAYERQIANLCEPERTCFLNFYTNSTGAAAAVPLPEAIANEATATYRRSMKNGVQMFMWSCRMRVPATDCF
jgi:hypothetical protein